MKCVDLDCVMIKIIDMRFNWFITLNGHFILFLFFSTTTTTTTTTLYLGSHAGDFKAVHGENGGRIIFTCFHVCNVQFATKQQITCDLKSPFEILC